MKSNCKMKHNCIESARADSLVARIIPAASEALEREVFYEQKSDIPKVYNRISNTLTLLSSEQLASCSPSFVLRHASRLICSTCA
jgi:hypothetical protein